MKHNYLHNGRTLLHKWKKYRDNSCRNKKRIQKKQKTEQATLLLHHKIHFIIVIASNFSTMRQSCSPSTHSMHSWWTSSRQVSSLPSGEVHPTAEKFRKSCFFRSFCCFPVFSEWILNFRQESTWFSLKNAIFCWNFWFFNQITSCWYHWRMLFWHRTARARDRKSVV